MCVATKQFVGSSRRTLRGIATHWGLTESSMWQLWSVMSGAASPGCCTALLCWALGCWRQPLACRAQETGTAEHMQEKGYSIDLGPKHLAQYQAQPAQCSAAWHLNSHLTFCK